MGANIGTTITGQLIALDIGAIAPLFAIAGVGAIMFIKSEKVHHISSIFAGLGILFMGMDMMGAAMSPLKESEAFYQSDDEVRQSASRYFGRRAFYGSDPVIFCIGRYFAGAFNNGVDYRFFCISYYFGSKYRLVHNSSYLVNRRKQER